LFEKRKDLTIEVPEDEDETEQKPEVSKALRSVKLMSKVLLRQPTPKARKIL